MPKPYLDIVVLVHQQVTRLEIPMDDLRLALMQPAHALGHVLEHLDTQKVGHVVVLVLQHLLAVALLQQLGDDGHLSGRGAGTHEQQHIRMPQLTMQATSNKQQEKQIPIIDIH